MRQKRMGLSSYFDERGDFNPAVSSKSGNGNQTKGAGLFLYSQGTGTFWCKFHTVMDGILQHLQCGGCNALHVFHCSVISIAIGCIFPKQICELGTNPVKPCRSIGPEPRFSIRNTITGEMSNVYLFVAVLPCSCYAYAEACDDMKSTNWLMCHVYAYQYFGDVTRLL